MEETVLILKVVREDMTSHDGFVWPKEGVVRPTTWDQNAACGNGLHGWLAGEGTYRHSFMDGTWIVFRANKSDVVSLDGGDKVKAREGVVLYCGDKLGAIEFLKGAGVLTKGSNPGWCCFTDTQLRELAYRAANRAVKTHAPKALRARKQEALALRMEAIPDIVDRATAVAARDEARSVRYAAAYAAADADADAAYAYADASASAAAAADAYAYASAAAAAAAADAAYAAAYAAADRKAEREAQRLDRVALLGL